MGGVEKRNIVKEVCNEQRETIESSISKAKSFKVAQQLRICRR